MILGGVCCPGSMVLLELDAFESLIKWLAFGGKLFISISFCSMYVFAAELFPTQIRSTGLSFGAMVGRLSGFAAPLMIELQFIDGM